MSLCFISALSIGCAKQPLTKEKAVELIEASPDFQPQAINVTLTEQEIQKGKDAGYWFVRTVGTSDAHLPQMGVLLLTPVGAAFFRGAPPLFNPVISITQPLGARVIEVTSISDDAGNPKQKEVQFKWIRRFENQAPDLVEIFKDQPVQSGKKKFRYGGGAWELAP